MELIPWQWVTQEGGDKDNIIVPMALDYSCPYCSRVVHFQTVWTGTSYDTYVCKARCSGCANYPLFVYVATPKQGSAARKGALFIHPYSDRRKPYAALNEIESLSNLLKEEYESAIRVFNMQEWIAASVLCRRLLEGIMRSLLPPDKHNKSLYEQILLIDQYTDLKKPIKDIADVLRIAGNRGAHFNPDSRPSRATLELMFDLVDYLLEYFFVLPNKTDRLRTNVRQIENGKSSD